MQRHWEPLFDPKDHELAKEELDEGEQRLSTDILKEVGAKVTGLR